MISTFQQLCDFIGPKVGFAGTHARTKELVNQAVELLLEKADWRRTLTRVRFCIWNNSIVLPYGIEKLLRIQVDGRARYTFDQPYEFMEGGPGDTEINGSVKMDLLDLGFSPWFYEIPAAIPLQLMAFSDQTADGQAEVSITGWSRENVEQADSLKLNHWTPGVINNPENLAKSVQMYREISKVIKPITGGYVSLYGYDPAERRAYFLAKYAPGETLPSYRRYKVLGYRPSGEKTVAHSILALVKCSFVPMSVGTEIPPIQSRSALFAAVQSLLYRERGLEQNAISSEAAAIRLQEQREGHERGNDHVTIDIHQGPMAMGDIFNVG